MADHVEIGQMLGIGRIDQPRQPGDRRIHRDPRIGVGDERDRLEAAVPRRQHGDVHGGRRPISGNRQFLVPAVGDPHGRPRRLRQLDGDDRLVAQFALRSEPAADMLGNHPHLRRFELEALGDLCAQIVHRLGRDLHRQPVAVEARHRRVRLQRGVLLDAGPERTLVEQRVAGLARVLDPAQRLLLLLGERSARPAHIALPRRRRRRRALGGVGDVALRAGIDQRRIRPAGGIGADHACQGFVPDLDGRKRGACGLEIDGRHRRDLLADMAHHAVGFEQRDRGLHAGDRQRRRKLQPGNARMRVLRAKHEPFELPFMARIDRVFRSPGHLVARFHPRRLPGFAVEAPFAGLGDGAQDVVIGPATAQMPAQRGGDLFARRRLRPVLAPPPVVKGRGLDDEARRAEAALQRVERHERLLHGMQPVSANPFDGGDRPALPRHSPASGSWPPARRRRARCRRRRPLPRRRAWCPSIPIDRATRRPEARRHRPAIPRHGR